MSKHYRQLTLMTCLTVCLYCGQSLFAQPAPVPPLPNPPQSMHVPQPPIPDAMPAQETAPQMAAPQMTMPATGYYRPTNPSISPFPYIRRGWIMAPTTPIAPYTSPYYRAPETLEISPNAAVPQQMPAVMPGAPMTAPTPMTTAPMSMAPMSAAPMTAVPMAAEPMTMPVQPPVAVYAQPQPYSTMAVAPLPAVAMPLVPAAGGLTEQHFGPGFYRTGASAGHYRFPYYSYRRPWYYPGQPSFNRSTDYVW